MFHSCRFHPHSLRTSSRPCRPRYGLSTAPAYEAELIALEENFWMNHVQAKAPPPYIENDGALILESLRRCMGVRLSDTVAYWSKMSLWSSLRRDRSSFKGRHYMAVMDLDRVYFCCLYGNSEDDVIIRSIDRDLNYEAELIALEENLYGLSTAPAPCPVFSRWRSMRPFVPAAPHSAGRSPTGPG